MEKESKVLNDTRENWIIRKTGAREKLSAFEFTMLCNVIEKLRKEDVFHAKK